MISSKIVNIILGILTLGILVVAFMSGRKNMFDDAAETIAGGLCVRCGKISKKSKTKSACEECELGGKL